MNKTHVLPIHPPKPKKLRYGTHMVRYMEYGGIIQNTNMGNVETKCARKRASKTI